MCVCVWYMCTHMQGHSYTKKPVPNAGCLPWSLSLCCFETGFCGTQGPRFQLDWLARKLELPGCTCLLLPQARLQTCLWIWLGSYGFGFSSRFHFSNSPTWGIFSLAPVLLSFFNPPQSLCLFFFSLLFFLLLSTHEKLNFWDPADDNVVSFFLGVLGIRWCQLSCIVALVLIFKQLCHDWFLLSPASPSLLWTTLITTVPWLAMGEFWTSLSVERKLIKLTSFLGESCQEGFLDAKEQLIALKGHRNNPCVKFCLFLCDHIASIYKLPR